MSAIYSVRYVHKISPRESDTHADVELSGNAFADRKALGLALRKAGVLSSGVQVESFRVEGEKVVVFPRGCIWHSVILTHQEPAPNRDESLTEKEAAILAALRAHVEAFEDTTELWGSVYIDNAKPENMPARSFAGVLSALERKGLYRPQGDDAFGYVRSV